MGGYLSGDNLVSMKHLNGFCGESGVKFNLFLICYSRYEKEKNWMCDGLKLVPSLCPVPHGWGLGPQDAERPAVRPRRPEPPARRRAQEQPRGRADPARPTTFASTPVRVIYGFISP